MCSLLCGTVKKMLNSKILEHVKHAKVVVKRLCCYTDASGFHQKMAICNGEFNNSSGKASFRLYMNRKIAIAVATVFCGVPKTWPG